jgi:hypothetical protein
MEGRMDGQIKRQRYEVTDVQMDRRTEGKRTELRTGGQTARQMNGRTDGTDGQINKRIERESGGWTNRQTGEQRVQWSDGWMGEQKVRWAD